MTVSRRNFVGGIAAAIGYLGVGPDVDLFAQTQGATPRAGRARWTSTTRSRSWPATRTRTGRPSR